MNGNIKLANKRYTSIKNDYNLTFGYDTVIEKCRNDEAIVGDAYNFTKLDAVENIV